jgi:CDP-paratose 2-epimerase
VRVLDNCSRAGTEKNRAHLESLGATGLELVDGDVREAAVVAEACADADAIFHLAAQVAVTDSVRDPRNDFEVNALGTLNVLEGARLSGRSPVVVYTSTNKVYGGLEDLEARQLETRYELPALPDGVPETRPVDFHSPYGCSKGAADLYAIDYARIYGIPAVSLRQSCIYGPWQYGNEDQGWIAHFLIRALRGDPITLYGDGRQVRDVLFVDDLVELYDVVLAAPDKIAGRAFNVGGGPGLTISLLEFLEHIRTAEGLDVEVSFDDWRPGDQRVYVSDVRRVGNELGWRPSTSLADGTRKLRSWLESNG